jgi:hypothetical protein
MCSDMDKNRNHLQDEEGVLLSMCSYFQLIIQFRSKHKENNDPILTNSFNR